MSQSVSEHRVQQRLEKRVYIFAIFMFLGFVWLTLQLGNLQLIKGEENRVLARRFVSRQEFTVAPRGLIYDRNYPSAESKPLVQNINYVSFVVYPSRFRNLEAGKEFILSFCSIMGRNCNEYREHFEPTAWRRLVRSNEPIVLVERMSRREHERLAEARLPGEYGDFLTNHLRYYTMGPAMAHVTGYVGLPSRRELEQRLALPYQMLGKGGIEARYDQELRGTDGIRIRHRIIHSEEQLAQSEQGNTLVLTIDQKVQAAAYNALVETGKRGAVVAMRVATGEIVAMASTPTFDPNILSSGSREQRNDHFRLVEEHKGFLNIATQGKFPPASTYKSLVALAAMESNTELPPHQHVTENTRYTCGGRWRLPSARAGASGPGIDFHCWQARGHGSNDMVGALAHSCNVYFYQLGNRIGPNPMIDYSRAFGLDKVTGVDLPGEVSSFVPDQRWKQITWSTRWYDGDTINLSIGQGYLETTPIAMASFYAAIANNGKLFRPYLVREIRDPQTNQVIRRFHPELVREIPIDPATFDTVQRGLRAVVVGGTAGRLNRPDLVPIAGKTGTVQTRGGGRGTSHAWFAAYAPYDAPIEEQIAVVAFIEYGIGGSLAGVPVVEKVMRAAFPEYSPLPEVRPIIRHATPIAPPPQSQPQPTTPAEKEIAE